MKLFATIAAAIGSLIAATATTGCIVAVFDEPEAGIDLWSFTRLIEVFTKHREERQGTMLVVSHQERLLEIADEIIVIANGKVTAQGSREEILPTLFGDQRHCTPCLKKEIDRYE